MTFDEYQKAAISTDAFGMKIVSVTDPAFVAKLLGLVGEAGEVAEKFKKIIRDQDGVLTDYDKPEIVKELGDVLWYVSALAYQLEIPLSKVVEVNIDKIMSRKARGTTKGSGDNR